MKKAIPKAESESFIEINFYHVNSFQYLLREKDTESNNKSNSNSKHNSSISIRKQLTLGTAAMTVM